MMKKVVLAAVCGIIAFVLVGCATGSIMTRNSYGYDATKQTEENLRLKDKRPAWFSQGKKRKDWEARNNPKGDIKFFYAECIKENVQVAREGQTIWTVDQASSIAFKDIMRQVSTYIDTEVETIVSDDVEETLTVDGTPSAKQQTKIQARAKYTDQFNSNSSSSFVGLRQMGKYTETWAQDIKKDKIVVDRVWVVYGITDANVQESIKKAREHRDSQERMALEAAEFMNLSGQLKSIKEELRDIDLSKAEVFDPVYDRLLEIYTLMDNLPLLKDNTDALGQQYSEVLEDSANELRVYNPNPVDRYLKQIEYLERQLALSNGEVAGLRNKQAEVFFAELETRDKLFDAIIAGKEGYSIRSQTYILSFPRKPDETLISSVNIYAANQMVSNMDYIAFTSIDGRNSFRRGEYGLNSPATLVSWNDAALFCNWLSGLYGLKPCYKESGKRVTAYDSNQNGYRLPSEEEIAAMYKEQPDFLNDAEFTKVGIWSSNSDGNSKHQVVYILSDESGPMDERYQLQTLDNTVLDVALGFMVVRNAK